MTSMHSTAVPAQLHCSQPRGLQVKGMRTARLPWRFDTTSALKEVQALPESLWQNHFNQGFHDGGWQALALRFAAAAPVDIVPVDVPVSAYADSQVLEQCPELRAMLNTMALPWKSVRLMRLLPSSEIKEHIDAGVCAANGEVRLHVPLQTDEQVFFHVDGERIPLRAGECWYVDVSRPHRVRNRGDQARVHLVADVQVDQRLLQAFGDSDAGEPLPEAGDPWYQFLQFRDLVGTHPAYCNQLGAISDSAEFVRESVRVGASEGFHFEACDVESAMKAGRRAWIEQWIL